MARTDHMQGWQNRIVGYTVKPASQYLAHPLNFRRHPKAQQEAVVGSLNDLGWIDCVLENVRTGHLIDGHERIFEALAKGEDTPVPCLQIDIAEEEEPQALLMLDPIAAMAETDKTNLDALLREVATGEAGVQAMLAELAAKSGLDYGKEPKEAPEPQVDRAAELQAKWQTQRGQIWACGKHRLMCGDSTSAEDVARLMDGQRAVLMATDPPYGVELDTTWREDAGISSFGPQSARDITWDANADWSAAYRLFGADVAFVWHAGISAGLVAESLVAAGFEIKQQIIWVKSVAAFTRSHYHWKHEPCWYAVRKGATAHWAGDAKQTTVWDAASPRHVMGGSKEEKQPHPTQKPAELFTLPMLNHTQPGDICGEPFTGSGTAFVAAEQTGRVCYGMEIEPKYVAVALERMQGLGLTPELVQD